MLPAPSSTPIMISIAIVSSITILLLDTYRGRNFRYRPTLISIASSRVKPKTHYTVVKPSMHAISWLS